MTENHSGVDECGSDGVSALLINEKGRNKRKFLSDFSLDNPVQVLTEFPRYELMEEKIRDAMNELGSMMVRKRSEDIVEEQDMEEFQQSDWDEAVTCQLEELLTNTLLSTFCTAVNKIVERGYSEEAAEWAVLHSSLFHGSTDAPSNVVDSSLALLKREKEFNTPKHPVFEGLQNLVDYILLEMINVLREVKPAMTVSDAMWCLLLSDLNLVKACAVEGGSVGSSSSQETPGEIEAPTQSKSETSCTSQSKDSINSRNAEQIMPSDKCSQPKASNQSTIKHCPCESGKGSSFFCRETKGKLAAIVKEHIQASQAIDEKSGSRAKCLSINSKMDMLRHKAFQFEKSYKSRQSKGSFKAKVAAWESMVLDKSLRSQSGSSCVATRQGSNDPSDTSPSLLPSISSKDPVFALPAVNSKTLASVPEANRVSKCEVNVSDTPKAIDYYASIPFDETLQTHVPQDDKDEAILVLVPHKKAIEKELQGWMEWAHEKIMQAARRLGKDQAELKTLRQEKEEIEKFKKEKQTLEESTMKRLSEMESALTNATGQIEVANRNIHRLEEENNMLKSDMEAAKVQALRAASNLQLGVQREQETLKKMQSWDAEKSLVQEQLKNLKRDVATLNNHLEKAKERQDQFKALLKREEEEKLKARKQIDSLRRKREEEEAVRKVEKDKVKKAAEKEMQKCEGDIKNLEKMIAELRLESNKLKIAALNIGYGSYFAGSVERGLDVKAERECIMCMTDEISVVFIPCGHQVLCSQCNVLHEKQGMNDCPSCRTQIQRRLSVSYRTD